jgi:hypothetical protein
MEKKVKQEETIETKPAKSKLTKLRENRKLRLGIIIFLLAVLAILFAFWEKARIFIAIAFITLLAALGLEIFQKDWDLQKLWETKSFQQSEIGRDAQGNLLFDKLGNITTDTKTGKKADDYNCEDFSDQPEAQAFFIKVGGTGNDLNRLDGDNDGKACEALPLGND